MGKPYPKEFRHDVAHIARRRETSLAQLTVDFGISEASIDNWLKQADIDDGIKPGLTSAKA